MQFLNNFMHSHFINNFTQTAQILTFVLLGENSVQINLQ